MRVRGSVAGLAPDGLWLGTWWQYLTGRRLAPFTPTPLPVCRAMLRLAAVGRGDAVVDLGSGDGRLLILAVKEFGAASAVGYETDARLATMSRASALEEGLGEAIEVREADARSADLSRASVVTMFLTTSGNAALLPQLARLPAGARVVSHYWPIEAAQPSEELKVAGTILRLFHAEGLRLQTKDLMGGRES